MASTAMRILTDPKARSDVRAEAVHALGMMQITNAVPKYNFSLIAYAAAQLAAQIGDQIVASYTEKGPAINATRAEYLASLLIGPIQQAFDGQPGIRAAASAQFGDGRLAPRAATSGRSSNRSSRFPARRSNWSDHRRASSRPDGKTWVTRVAVLKEFLAKNARPTITSSPTTRGSSSRAARPPLRTEAMSWQGARGGK